MIVLIDNYDSFSYNLFQYIGTLNEDIKVLRNDAMSIDAIAQMHASHIILSPGPGYPRNAGVCIDLVRQLGKTVPILGVCLGHQAICEAYGARIGHAAELMHGKQSHICIDTSTPLFAGLPERIFVARYHSLAALAQTMPACLRITARADDGEIMAVQHCTYPVFGVQFHPESIMTPQGIDIIRNFLQLTA